MTELITAIEAYDVRFPTSRQLDGSDAMNPDPDYSAAYVILRTERRAARGTGSPSPSAAATTSQVAAIEALAPLVVGLPVAEVLADLGGVLAAADRRQPAALARPGEGRHAHGGRRRRQRAVGPVGRARGQAAVAAAGRAVPGAARRPRRLPLPAATRSPARRRWTSCARAEPGRAERDAHLLARRATRRTPPRPAGSATTTTSWSGWPRRPSPTGFTQIKLKVGADPRRRRAPDAAGPRGGRPGHPHRRSTPTSAGTSARRSPGCAPLAPFDPYWIEEPTSPDDVLGHAAIREAVAPDQGRHRRARPEPGDVQAAAAGRRDRRPAARREPGRRA